MRGMTGTIYRQKKDGLAIRVGLRPKAELLDLLKRIVWGGQGSRFQVQGIEKRIGRLRRPLFMSLEKGGEVIGGYCFSRREVKVLGKNHAAVFRTAFAVDDRHAGKGYGRLLAKVSKDYFQRRSTGLSYGFVEDTNVRSLKALRKARYDHIGSFEPVLFSRLRPLRKIAFSILSEKEERRWKAHLQKIYRDHALVHFDSPKGENYFVAKKRGRITAGVQARRVQMRLKEIEGPFGLLLKWSRFQRCEFLTFEAVYHRKGFQRDLFALLETLLSEFGVRCGVLFLDRRSPWYPLFKRSGQLGLFDKLHPTPSIHVMGLGIKKEIGPYYISASDVI